MELTPKGFGENLNQWFRSLGRNWHPLLILSLITHLPVAVVVTLAFLVTGAGEAFATLTDPELAESLNPDEVIDLMIPFAWGLGVWVVTQTIAAVLVYVSASRVVVNDLTESDRGWRVALREGWRRLPSALGASLLIVAGGLVAIAVATYLGWVIIASFEVDFFSVFLVAVIALTVMLLLTWLLVSVAFVPQAIATEDIGAFRSIGRSFTMVQGRWWATLGFLFLVSLIASVAGQAVGAVTFPFFLAGFAYPSLLAVVYGVVALLQGPMVAAIADAYALWYLDLRSRKETLTTEMLAS